MSVSVVSKVPPSDLHIGVVGPAAPPAGGMAGQTSQLCRLLAGEGLTVEFLQTNLPYRPAWVAKLPGVRALFRLLDYGWRVWQLSGRVEVIHLMSNSGWSWQLFSAPVLWLARWRGTPVIVNYRGGEAGEYLRHSWPRVRPSLQRASQLVVPSTFLQEVFAGYDLKAQVIPNIIDTDRFQPAQHQLLTKQRPLQIVVTRNLEAIYDIATAIRTLAALQQRGLDCQLAVAGSGPEEHNLRQLVQELGLTDKVSFLGRLEREQMAALYQDADFFLNTSRVDNMPNSLLEAMACGLPVVSTNAGGIPRMVEHERTALLTGIGDVSSLAAAVERLVAEPDLRQRLISQGLEQIQQYRWSAVRQQWLALYQQVLHRQTLEQGEQA